MLCLIIVYKNHCTFRVISGNSIHKLCYNNFMFYKVLDLLGLNSGIYKIENKINGMIYIGQAISFNKRFNHHKSALRRGIHGNPYLQNAWNKYGESCFSFDILEYVEKDEKKLLEREKYYYKLYSKSSIIYNLREPGNIGIGKPRGPMSEEHKRKIAAATKGEKHPNYGKKPTKEHLESMSSSVHQLDPVDGIILNTFYSANEASRTLNIPTGSILDVCKGRYTSAGGFVWCYVGD